MNVVQGNVGIILRLRDDTKLYVVVRVTENGPAAKSGEVVENDVLLAVAGKPVNGLSLADVNALLEGPVDSFVRLKLQRENAAFDCRLRRGDPNDWKAKKDAKKPIAVKEAVKAPEKMTDRMRAERLLNGDQYRAVNKRVREHDAGKLSPRSLEAERVRVRKEHDAAQRKADALYAASVARDEEEKRKHTDALLDTVCGSAPAEPKESWWQRKRRETTTWWQAKKRDLLAYLAINLVEHKIARAQAAGGPLAACPSLASLASCCGEPRKPHKS
jgi:hypothetical protein